MVAALAVALWAALLVGVMMVTWLLQVRAADLTEALWDGTWVVVQMLVLVADWHVGRVRKAWHRAFHAVRHSATRRVLRTWAVLRVLWVLVVPVALVVVGVIVWVVRHRHARRWWRRVVRVVAWRTSLVVRRHILLLLVAMTLCLLLRLVLLVLLRCL